MRERRQNNSAPIIDMLDIGAYVNNLNDARQEILTMIKDWQPDPYNASEVRFYDSLYIVERRLADALMLFERGL